MWIRIAEGYGGHSQNLALFDATNRIFLETKSLELSPEQTTLHHIALKVTDINSALASLERAGHVMLDAVGRPGSRRALIGFIHPKSLNGVLMHLVQRGIPCARGMTR